MSFHLFLFLPDVFVTLRAIDMCDTFRPFILSVVTAGFLARMAEQVGLPVYATHIFAECPLPGRCREDLHAPPELVSSLLEVATNWTWPYVARVCSTVPDWYSMLRCRVTCLDGSWRAHFRLESRKRASHASAFHGEPFGDCP